MKIKLTSLFFLIFLAKKCKSQEKSSIIFGKINSSNKSVSDVHIFNLNNKHGSISNNAGDFEILTAVNDTLLISSIQFKRKIIVITEKHIISKNIIIQLIPIVNILDEVFLKGLTGSLELDSKSIPKDSLPKHNFVIIHGEVRKLGPDYKKELSKPPDSEAFTNPIQMNGVGGSVAIPDKRYEEQRKFKRILSKKKQFPGKIIKEIGIAFFTINLKIPEDKINQFISYFEYRNIIDKYYKNNLIEVIQIFKEERIVYNSIKN
jgi:hypothetical protein